MALDAMLTDDSKQVFYSDRDGRPSVIDVAITHDDGNLHGAYSGQTLEEIRTRYEDARVMTLDEASSTIDRFYRRPATEIDSAAFWYALEVLPPAGWVHDPNRDAESFKCSERTSGNITNIYARVGQRFFELSDDIHTPHSEIIARCMAL